ncbi:bifunctional 5,10-methylene-tetrahydrofolate dehydrogenase/5,10-methylene-tetrahydrofolate cyclohydrolase [Candidatus Roizmanbacteria bacterium CG_4_10_14_0_8_um_filter_39_9]|uniref:Bifunctional protein FolD n=1 Tax=Candidatus Roizmanbacteria bacterium CG_4_10_14_0_8_um_filter_39_9 TaxID=1974829 RepID=A0A2M7QCM0_9BACT|nr:MAG: bifunctional 5,10-methylene-tetrahydrofolate dehydrogenase/5,10-methylene-tetrahydrofolate cyclohydrolase [Candidatus Roizmanbacteria bacterium CG_4_10_14_0_8_um_filter_39_9]
MAIILDGVVVSHMITSSIKNQVAKMERKPGLAVVLVGDDPASHIYVNAKEEACHEVGIYSRKIILPATTSEMSLLDDIKRLNADAAIDGILVQLPLPDHIDEATVLAAVDPRKDVDCLHPDNIAKYRTQTEKIDLESSLLPCTPKGIIKLIESTGYEIEGKKAVVVGRSFLIGKPTAFLLENRGAVVTVCHSQTANLKEEVLTGDIAIAAVGKKDLITADMIKLGAFVVDVGTNRIGDQVYGDVDFEKVSEVAGYITPVPGGVGPMTIAMLLENTLLLAEQSHP